MATPLITSAANTFRSATFTVTAGTPRKLTLAAPSGQKVSPDAQALLYTVNASTSETYTGFKLSATQAELASLNVVAAGGYKLYLYASKNNLGVDID